MTRTRAIRRLLRVGTVLCAYAGPGVARSLRAGSWGPLARALCRAFEQLGPAFIKLGQFLSVRPDLVPPAALAEFERLQDQARPLPFRDLAAVLQAELLAAPAQLFRGIDPVPVATASLSQVHRAQLPDGTLVAVKIQRPGAEDSLLLDLHLLRAILCRVLPLTPLRQRVDPRALAAELLDSVTEELDFRVEAERACRFRHHFRNLPRLRVPRVHWAWCSRRVLTTEWIDGVKISALPARLRDDYRDLAELGATAFLQQVLEHGLFHADLHPANLLITPHGEITYLDFGIAGRLDGDEQRAVLGALAGLLARDPHLALRNLARLGVQVPADHRAGFVRDIQQVMEHATGPSLADVSLTRIGRGILAAVHRNRVMFPRRHALLVKALLTVEGSARLLHPQFAFEEAARKYLFALTRKQLSWSQFAEAGWRGVALLGAAAVSATEPSHENVPRRGVA